MIGIEGAKLLRHNRSPSQVAPLDQYLETERPLRIAQQQAAAELESTANILRLWLRPYYGQVLWRKLLDGAGVHYRQRSVSGALVSLCLTAHQELTPSFFMYPSGRCICYGCGYEGETADFIVDQHVAPVRQLLLATELQPPDILASQCEDLRAIAFQTMLGQLALFDERSGEKLF